MLDNSRIFEEKILKWEQKKNKKREETFTIVSDIANKKEKIKKQEHKNW